MLRFVAKFFIVRPQDIVLVYQDKGSIDNAFGGPQLSRHLFFVRPKIPSWSWLGSCKVVGELGGKGKRPIRFRKVK